MNKYNKIARKIKFTLIILILLAIMYPVTIIVFNIFNYVELTNYLLSISSYLGAIVGSIIGIIGAVYVIFVSLAFEEKNKYKNKLPKKLRTLDRIKELENEMILFSYNEGIDLKNSGINKATYTYVKRFKEFYENLMDLSIEVDIDFFNKCNLLFEENNYLIMLIENSSESEGAIDDMKLPTSIVSNLDLFQSEQTKKIIKLSNKKAKELNTKRIDEKGYYDLYELAFILNANANQQLRELIDVTNTHREDLIKEK